MSPERAAELAGRLQAAWQDRVPIPPLSEDAGLENVDDAYAVQTAWTERRVAAGEQIVGWKIGLTSKAVQEQMGVHEPDYGTLWGSRWVQLENGRGEVGAETFVQPRVEGELAFLLGDPPRGPGISAEDVLAATEGVAAAIEIVDSRIEDWRITLPDTVADNASYGGFAVGRWSPVQPDRRLSDRTMTVTCGGEVVAEGTGAEALGDPAHAVAWLLNKLAAFGVRPRRGDFVLSGAWAATVPASAGEEFRLEMDGEPAIEIAFG